MICCTHDVYLLCSININHPNVNKNFSQQWPGRNIDVCVCVCVCAGKHYLVVLVQ